LLPPPDELDDLRPLDELDREVLDFEELDLDEPDRDLARVPDDRLDEPLRVLARLPDFAVEAACFFVVEARLRPELLEPREPLERPELFERAELRRPCCEPPPSLPLCSSSSPLPINFLATPTAAGTATPIAAPATTFLPVERPSPFSFSSISTSLTGSARSAARLVERVDELRDDPFADEVRSILREVLTRCPGRILGSRNEGVPRRVPTAREDGAHDRAGLPEA
jgi:hypothetical protein